MGLPQSVIMVTVFFLRCFILRSSYCMAVDEDGAALRKRSDTQAPLEAASDSSGRPELLARWRVTRCYCQIKTQPKLGCLL